MTNNVGLSFESPTPRHEWCSLPRKGMKIGSGRSLTVPSLVMTCPQPIDNSNRAASFSSPSLRSSHGVNSPYSKIPTATSLCCPPHDSVVAPLLERGPFHDHSMG